METLEIKSTEIKSQAENIRNWLDNCDPQNAEIQRHIRRGISVIHARQTQDEQRSEHTRYRNGRGFTCTDAPFASKLLRWPSWRTDIADKARRVLRKYAMQLAEEKLSQKA